MCNARDKGSFLILLKNASLHSEIYSRHIVDVIIRLIFVITQVDLELIAKRFNKYIVKVKAGIRCDREKFKKPLNRCTTFPQITYRECELVGMRYTYGEESTEKEKCLTFFNSTMIVF